ncbi:acyltransferase family protein, partial [Pantoea piersonii]
AAALMRRLPFPLLVAALVVAANMFFVVKFFVKDFGEWVNLIPVTARFMVFYAAGYALYLNSDQIPRQARNFLVNTKVVLALGVACWLVFYAIYHYNITSSLKYLPVLCASLFSVIFSYWVVFTFEKLRMKESRLVRGVVDSALVIYIMHYPLVITFAWLLDGYLPDALPVTYVAVVTLLGLICSAVLYLIIKQLPLMALLFGLKPARVQNVPATDPRG